MRENTEQMQLPRFLWVPFELGRPFGAPGEPDFQRRVLRSALELLERTDGPVILEDFPDDAPAVESPDDEATWACPVSFHPADDGEHDLVRETLGEIDRLAPWHEGFVANAARRGTRAAPAASGLAHEAIVRGLHRLVEGVEDPDVGTDLPLREWVRLGCDDLRTWYMEAAQGQPGRSTSQELRDWFWKQTALARLIGLAGMHLVRSEDETHRMFGLRLMVPRVYMRELMPGVEPFL